MEAKLKRTFFGLFFLLAFVLSFGCSQRPLDSEAETYLKTSNRFFISPWLHMSSRPMKKGITKLAADMDQAKLLGMSDHAGWVTDGDALVGSSQEGSVCLYRVSKFNDFEKNWCAPLQKDMTAPAFFKNRHVIVADRTGKLYKFDRETGKTIWSTDLDSFVIQPMVDVGADVLVVTGAQMVYRISAETGKVVWVSTGGPLEGLPIRTWTVPRVDEQRVFVGLPSGKLLVLQTATGQLLREVTTSLDVTGRFHDVVGEIHVAQDHIVFARYDGFLGAVKVGTKDDQRLLWEAKEKMGSFSASLVHQESMFLGTAEGLIYRVNLQDGQRLWALDLGAGGVNTLSLHEGKLFVTTSDGAVSAVDILNGQKLWCDRLGATIMTPPLRLKNDLYFSSGLKNLYGFVLSE